MDSSTSQGDMIFVALRRILRAVGLHSRRLADDHGLTVPQLVVLRAVAELGSSPIGALARDVHLSQPTVTGIIDRLERHGWVRRARNPADRRQVQVRITPAGSEALRAAPSLVQDTFRRELDRLKQWEQSQILATLQRIASMMEADDLDAAPHLLSEAVLSEAGAHGFRKTAGGRVSSSRAKRK